MGLKTILPVTPPNQAAMPTEAPMADCGGVAADFRRFLLIDSGSCAGHMGN
jgi:hypothetical protein